MVLTFFFTATFGLSSLMTLIAAGNYASKVWAYRRWLGATTAAAGLAQINALGQSVRVLLSTT